MPTLEYQPSILWENYHLTEKIWVERPAIINSSDDEEEISGPQRFCRSLPALQKYICDAREANAGAGLIGLGWSFAPLIGMPKLQIDLRGLGGCSPARPEDLHSECEIAAEDIALVGGGATVRAIAEWAKPRGKSLFTSGTHLAPTIAGAAATASHGSRLGYGGIQNQIIGMSFVTGPNTAVWVERETQPVLEDSAANIFATRIIRNDDVFEDALIHLGGMGIVNGVAMRLADYKKYHVLADDHALWSGWLHQVSTGDFRTIARNLGHDANPVFYEVTIDPSNFMGPHALHICYFQKEDGAGQPPATSAPGTPARCKLARPIDAVSSICSAPPPEAIASSAQGGKTEQAFNLMALYASEYFQYHRPPIDTSTDGFGWEEIHDDVITGGVAGALYNASYAINRQDCATVVPLICNAVKHLPATFIFTLRFVTNPAGTLAFTRFPETVVIEIDGLSPNAPDLGDSLGHFTRSASLMVRDALDAANIDYSMHWAKLGELDASKIERDFGPASDECSPIGRWRATRKQLLEPGYEDVFWNRALRNYGLINQSSGDKYALSMCSLVSWARRFYKSS